jgi:hypothetical protein
VQGGTAGTTTGVYYPAANQVALATNGTLALIVDSSQNVGIGTASPSQKLTVRGGRSVFQANSDFYSIQVEGGAGGGQRYIGATNEALPSMVFSNSGGTEQMRILSTGNILSLAGGSTTATGTGIAFPATQSASSDANTLDDYEEGTFTTTLTNCGSGIASGGTYVKIGNVVTARLTISGGTYTLNSSRFTLPFSAVALQAGTFTIGTLRGGFIEVQGASSTCYFATTDSGTAYPTITYIVA